VNEIQNPGAHTISRKLNANLSLAFYGFYIPHLPDFLLDHTLLGQTPSEKLEETLGSFERIVIGLRKFQNAAYALRFISDPQNGTIHTLLLGRILDHPAKANALAQYAAQDVSALLTSYGIPCLSLTQGGIAPLSLEWACNPFGAQMPAVIEIRQGEDVLKFSPRGDANANQLAYVVYPHIAPEGAFIEPFETVIRQSLQTVISVYLQPTESMPQEIEDINIAAQIGQTLGDLSSAPISQTGIQRWKDPVADMVGRIYANYGKSLIGEQFLGVTQVLCTDRNIAWNVARSFASSLGMTNGKNRRSDTESTSQPQIVAPRSMDENTAALYTFQQLIWTPWGESKATKGKERFPYLMGSRGASSIFRFPVSVHGGVPGIAVRQSAPDFEPGPRPAQLASDELLIGNLQRGGFTTATLKDLTRHTLITGFTGSGKTNTVLNLLNQVWTTQKIPFLVIESAKKEYRALANVPGFQDLLIFTFGDETTSPFRFNPFELLPGVRLEAHLGRLQACFDAALPQFGILPSLIAESLEEIYKAKGWKLADRYSGDPQDNRLFPTMKDMLKSVVRAAEGRGYSGEMRDNIRAASAGRIGSLLRGSKGRMFGGQRSFPADVIFKRPVILELNDLNEDDKALTMMFLLMWLREYRELHVAPNLQHLTVVEEAHNVVSNVSSVGNTETSADTKAKAVAAFSNMLSEVRAYGEGIVISDQSPEKLAPDAMRNTNLQIAHQLRDRRDRDAIARSMIMDDNQQNYLGKLRTGEAAFFRTGMEKATFIRVPEFKDSAGFNQLPDDAKVRQHMQTFHKQYSSVSLPFDGCKFCGTPCMYRENVEPLTLEKERAEEFKSALYCFETNADMRENWRGVAKLCLVAAKHAGHAASLDAAFCYLAHEIDFPFVENMRDSFMTLAGKELK
jgi:hypothetical protein